SDSPTHKVKRGFSKKKLGLLSNWIKEKNITTLPNWHLQSPDERRYVSRVFVDENGKEMNL
ncbi:10356_t:CDS:2, partial [Entrophospora sp. SA101]